MAGNLALCQIGKRGVDAIHERFPQVKPEQWQRDKRLYDQHGSLALLLSGVPVLGSLLTTAAGAFNVRPFTFVVLVFVATLVRSWLLAILFYGTYNHFRG